MALPEAVARICRSRQAFVSRLKVIDKQGKVCTMSDPVPGQIEFFNVLGNPLFTEVVATKPRQIRFSTTNCADVWHKTYTSRTPHRTIVATNHTDTTKSIFGKFRTFWETMPQSLRQHNPFKVNLNDHTITSEVSGAMIDHLTAGGTGHGRSWTYQLMVAEELAFWKNAEDVWAALTNTLDDQCPIRIISTANGPGNLYHKKVMAARQAERDGVEGVKFIFSRWADHPEYQAAPPQGWEPTHEEYLVAKKHGLTWEQLYWRHTKINGVRGIGERRFRHEFPLTPEEGFIVVEGGWFDVDYLNDVYNSLPAPTIGRVRIYELPIAGVAYAAGVDPSWCNGGDDAVCQILSEDGREVAVLSTNEGGLERFGEDAAELCLAYKARALPEANPGGGGETVIRIFEEHGVKMWKEKVSEKLYKDFTTHAGNKQKVYSHARQMVNGDALTLYDHTTIEQLMHIREVDNKIEGQDGSKDDHAMALVLAEWNRRTLPTADASPRESRRRYTRPSPMSAMNRARARL